METPLIELFDAFSLKCVQLKQAVANGHDDLVRLLDRELEPMIADILSYRARTREDAYRQLQFLNGLIRDEADDRSSVTRRSAAMSMLIDRYFRGANEGYDSCDQLLVQKENCLAFNAQAQPLFNEAILDSLPDRIAVITRDYRYLYANRINAEFLGYSQLSVVGRHVSEFIGEKSFEAMAKPAFDRCFSGQLVDYLHLGRRDQDEYKTRCRMSPLRAANNEIIGAVVVLQEVHAMVVMENS